MGFLAGKKALIVGVLSDKSIASGIASALSAQGAELAFTYQNDKFKDRVASIAAEYGSDLLFPCDVTNDNQINQVISSLQQHWDQLDVLVHSVAFAPADQLEGSYVDAVTREGFAIAHDISSYSFVALAKAAKPILAKHASLLTLSYIGAERAIPNYNVMGVAKASLEANVRYMAQSLGPHTIRVNAISSGPIRTLAASGIKDFRKNLANNEKVVPLRQNVTIEQVGNAAAFLCSELASGITGEVLHVDAGYHCVSGGTVPE